MRDRAGFEGGDELRCMFAVIGKAFGSDMKCVTFARPLRGGNASRSATSRYAGPALIVAPALRMRGRKLPTDGIEALHDSRG